MTPDTERLSLRLNKDSKLIFKKAADILGVSLTDFVVNASVSEASNFIKKHTEILCLINCSEIFAKTLIK